MLGHLTDREIDDVLDGEVIGRIGCHAAGRTYVVPITYVYDGGCVYGHSAVGMKLSMMRSNPSVCFEVEQVDDLSHWRSVVAWGQFEELEGDASAAGMRLLVSRLLPLIEGTSAEPSHGIQPQRPATPAIEAVVYRIRLGERTGRFESR